MWTETLIDFVLLFALTSIEEQNADNGFFKCNKTKSNLSSTERASLYENKLVTVNNTFICNVLNNAVSC